MPTKKADVPSWLTSAFGVAFKDGEPLIPGWSEAVARADVLAENRALPWREKVHNRRASARETTDPKARNSLRLEVAKARVAMLSGAKVPKVQSLARAEFIERLRVFSTAAGASGGDGGFVHARRA